MSQRYGSLIRIVEYDKSSDHPGDPAAKSEQKNNQERATTLADN